MSLSFPYLDSNVPAFKGSVKTTHEMKCQCKIKIIVAYLLAALGGNAALSGDDLRDILGSVEVDVNDNNINNFLSLSVERLSSMKKYVFGSGSVKDLVSAIVIGSVAYYISDHACHATIVDLALSSTVVVL
ncbi:hypothetical protein VNO78_23609 [Psophocarpus tetragonolobus]|uniref:Uncharacterized protein n=1 Tax=Psophocarpus tetragonolobus TaxID=3891 RepID=A0AAN9XE10_PSOTE